MATIEVSPAEAFGFHRLLAAKARKLGKPDEAKSHEKTARAYMKDAEEARVESIVKATVAALSSQGIDEKEVREAISLRAKGNPVCSMKGREKAGKKTKLLHDFLDLAQES